MIKGEKKFTKKRRVGTAKDLRTYAKNLMDRGAALMELARAFELVEDQEEFVELHRKVPDEIARKYNLRECAWDLRHVCDHCGKKAHGGVGNTIRSRASKGRRGSFYCWRKPCQKALAQAEIEDLKKNPKLYPSRPKKRDRYRGGRRPKRPDRRRRGSTF